MISAESALLLKFASGLLLMHDIETMRDILSIVESGGEALIAYEETRGGYEADSGLPAPSTPSLAPSPA